MATMYAAEDRESMQNTDERIGYLKMNVICTNYRHTHFSMQEITNCQNLRK